MLLYTFHLPRFPSLFFNVGVFLLTLWQDYQTSVAEWNSKEVVKKLLEVSITKSFIESCVGWYLLVLLTEVRNSRGYFWKKIEKKKKIERPRLVNNAWESLTMKKMMCLIWVMIHFSFVVRGMNAVVVLLTWSKYEIRNNCRLLHRFVSTLVLTLVSSQPQILVFLWYVFFSNAIRFLNKKVLFKLFLWSSHKTKAKNKYWDKVLTQVLKLNVN